MGASLDFSRPLIWLDNYASAKRLAATLAGDAVAGPGFEYKVNGELAPAPLLDAFVSAAGFIENLGLDVSAAVSAMSFPPGDNDAVFFEALALFWRQGVAATSMCSGRVQPSLPGNCTASRGLSHLPHARAMDSGLAWWPIAAPASTSGSCP
mgnify:CR=1 FL=1